MEPLAIYLAPKGGVPGIGPEKGRTVADGISAYKDPYGSTRYVLSISAVPVAALQVVSRNKKHAIIANVYTLPTYRRQGYAARLLHKARQDFVEVKHAHESMLSPEGKAFSSSVRDFAFGGANPKIRRGAPGEIPAKAGMKDLATQQKEHAATPPRIVRETEDRGPRAGKALYVIEIYSPSSSRGRVAADVQHSMEAAKEHLKQWQQMWKQEKEMFRKELGGVSRDSSKLKKERYRLPEHRSSFHKLDDAIIGWTPASELHRASAKSWRESAEGILKHYRGIGRRLTAREREDVAQAREFIRRAKAHETRAGSKKLAQTSRRAIEAELWKSWPANYKRPRASGATGTKGGRAIVVKNKDNQSELVPLSSLSDKEIFHLLHPARRDPGSRRGSTDYPRVYFEKGAAWKKSTWRPGYYHVVAQTTKPGMSLIDEDRQSRAGELSYAIGKTPRGAALWVLAKNTRPVRVKNT